MIDDRGIEEQKASDLVTGGSHDDDLLRFCRWPACVVVNFLPSTDDDLLRLI